MVRILQEISRYLKFCSFLFLPFGFSYLLMINISGAAGETSCARDMPDACGNEFFDIFLNSSKQTFQFSLRIPNLLSPSCAREWHFSLVDAFRSSTLG